MLDQYVKLFNISWIEPWMVEALGIMFGAMLLAVVVAKTMDFLNGERK
jgi:hypothetical protein